MNEKWIQHRGPLKPLSGIDASRDRVKERAAEPVEGRRTREKRDVVLREIGEHVRPEVLEDPADATGGRALRRASSSCTEREPGGPALGEPVHGEHVGNGKVCAVCARERASLA